LSNEVNENLIKRPVESKNTLGNKKDEKPDFET